MYIRYRMARIVLPLAWGFTIASIPYRFFNVYTPIQIRRRKAKFRARPFYDFVIRSFETRSYDFSQDLIMVNTILKGSIAVRA